MKPSKEQTLISVFTLSQMFVHTGEYFDTSIFTVIQAEISQR